MAFELIGFCSLTGLVLFFLSLFLNIKSITGCNIIWDRIGAQSAKINTVEPIELNS